ncbi:MAG: hypothetical protein AB7K78_25730, partial [Xanthobacteraceae bacterium]
MKPPKWNVDDDVMVAWVGNVFDEWEYLDVMEAAACHTDHPGIPLSEILDHMEAEAVAAARQGNFRPIADIIEKRNPLFEHGPDWHMGPKANALVAARLRGELNLGRGTPKKSEEQRRMDNPVHDAADEVGWITKLLVDNYPNEKGHRERSITVAAKRAGLR